MGHYIRQAGEALFDLDQYKVEVTPKIDVWSQVGGDGSLVLFVPANEAGLLAMETVWRDDEWTQGGVVTKEKMAYIIINDLLDRGVTIYWDDEHIAVKFEGV